MRIPSNLPPGCTDREIDEAFGLEPLFEKFCEEFAEGEHNAAGKIATLYVAEKRIRVYQTAATIAITNLLQDVGDLEATCDMLDIRRYYGAALEAAWREHNDTRP